MNDARPLLWSRDEVLAACGGRASGADWSAAGLSIDSRTLQHGDLFVAVRGENHDGHDFLDAAYARGAAAALVAEDRVGETSGPAIRVDDVQAAIEKLGAAGRRRSRAGIVAITGSVGKTSTKEALRHVLSAQAPTSASAASFNNHIGVPISLARLSPTARWGVFEIGMNHAGEIAPLARQVQAQVAIITEVAPVHIEFFPSVEAIAREKAQIFVGMRGGTAILNRDNAYFELMAAEARRLGAATILSFGEHAMAEMRLQRCAGDAEGSEVDVLWQGRALHYRVGAAGLHWAKNSLAVLLAVAALGGDLDQAATALAGVQAVSGRGARRRLQLGNGTVELIDESYNASPTSVRAMLQALSLQPRIAGRRRILVLGDMRELGDHSAEMHRALIADVAASDVDTVFACGPWMKLLFEGLPAALRGAHAGDAAALAPLVLAALRDGDTVAIKGSLGSRMKLVVEALLAAEQSRPEAA